MPVCVYTHMYTCIYVCTHLAAPAATSTPEEWRKAPLETIRNLARHLCCPAAWVLRCVISKAWRLHHGFAAQTNGTLAGQSLQKQSLSYQTRLQKTADMQCFLKTGFCPASLGLQIARSWSYFCALGPKVSIIYTLGDPFLG